MAHKQPRKPKVRTVAQLLRKYVNRRIAFRATEGGMEVYCWCEDATVAYGRERLYIMPVRGEGGDWVGIERCRVMEGSRDETATHEQAGDPQPGAGQRSAAVEGTH